jgi:hypothetical protein
MARQAAADARNAYLVEHYRPGLQVGGLRCLAALVRAAVEEFERKGRPVRFVRTTIVPADESVLCIVEAESEELLSEAYGRAGISFDRISVVLREQAPSSTSDDRQPDPSGSGRLLDQLQAITRPKKRPRSKKAEQ